MKILIITGGNSSERKISLISAKAVKYALEKNGHLVEFFDLRGGYRELKKVIPDFDVIFPMLHGEEGEGGELQKFLSKSGKPFVGGDWKGFKKGWYKIPFKSFCKENNIPTSPWRVVNKKEYIIKFGFPCVLKASNGGSSKEVVMIHTKSDLVKCSRLFKSKFPLFVERFLEGVEVTVGILENRVLPLVEIIPPKGEWFSFQNKYSNKIKEIPFAPSISRSMREKIQNIALRIHKKLNLGHISRIDFIVTDNIAFAIDVNTIPGMTPKSLFPKAAQAAGINFPQLTQTLIELACKSFYSRSIIK